MKSILIILLLTLLTAGCAVGPDYSRPAVETPATWKEKPAATDAAALAPDWWRIFNDAELDSLETQAVAANQELKRAVARVTEARAVARVSQADWYPAVAADGGYTRTHLSRHRANVAPKLESDDFSG